MAFQKKILLAKPEINGESVKPDWAARFFDNVKYCSDDEVKNMWANILAGEIKNPGKYSYRTLDFLKNITKEEAQTIIKYAPRIFLGKLIELNDGNHVLDYSTLDDIGFIIGSELVQNLDIKVNEDVIAFYNNKSLLMYHNNTDKDIRISYPIKKLTKCGNEILDLIEIEDDDNFQKEFSKSITHNYKGISVTKHTIYSIDKNQNIQYNVEPIWTIP